MKTLCTKWSGISCGFRSFFLFSAIFALTSPASAANGQLTVNPSTINFGGISVGTSQKQAVTLKNSGGSRLSITDATVSGTNFTLSGLSYPMSLGSGQSATCYVTFKPQSASIYSGGVSIAFITRRVRNSSWSGSPVTVILPVSGTGVGSGQLTATPSSLVFGSVQVGNAQTLAETLTNSGGASVTISAVSATSSFTASGLSLPLTLSAGQSASFNVAFSPTSSGTVSGSMTITSNASNPALKVPLSGTGVTAGQLTANPSSLVFSSVQVGNAQTLAETLTNSGGASVTISAVSATSSFAASGLSLPLTLSAGQSASFNVAFSPTSSGTVSGSMTITSNASNPALTAALSGTGVTAGQLTASPASLAFGSVPVGSSTSLAQTIKNSGGTALTISQITPGGTGFSFSGITLPLTLAAAQSMTFNVSFAPQAGGSVSGNLGISSNGSNPTLSVPLTGTGAIPGQLTVTPLTLNFGSVVAGTSQSQTGVLSAGSAAITVSSVGVSGSQFSVTGISLPVTIAAGSSLSFQVAFTPQNSGTASSNVTFVSNASNSPTVESLSGSATSPQHSVSLSWNTSTSSGVAGYNVYRGSVTGGPYTRINSALDTTPFATDSTVQGGLTYYYVTTAVDSSGRESSYSNQVQAVIPSP